MPSTDPRADPSVWRRWVAQRHGRALVDGSNASLSAYMRSRYWLHQIAQRLGTSTESELAAVLAICGAS